MCLPTEVRIRSQVSPFEICGAQGGTRTAFSPSISVSRVSIFPPTLHTHCLYTLQLPGGTAEAWEPPKNQEYFGNPKAFGKYSTNSFPPISKQLYSVGSSTPTPDKVRCNPDEVPFRIQVFRDVNYTLSDTVSHPRRLQL